MAQYPPPLRQPPWVVKLQKIGLFKFPPYQGQNCVQLNTLGKRQIWWSTFWPSNLQSLWLLLLIDQQLIWLFKLNQDVVDCIYSEPFNCGSELFTFKHGLYIKTRAFPWKDLTHLAEIPRLIQPELIFVTS